MQSWRSSPHRLQVKLFKINAPSLLQEPNSNRSKPDLRGLLGSALGERVCGLAGQLLG